MPYACLITRACNVSGAFCIYTHAIILRPALAETFDQKLIDACVKGDRKAQKKIFDLLAPKMFSLCIRYVGDRAKAEDVLQDGFVSLFSKIDSYAGNGSFEGWARRIFVNTALMELRKKEALKMSDPLETARGSLSDNPTPLEDIGYKELMQLITQLPDKYRAVFNLFVIDGYTHKEIAEELGITEVTSRSQLGRARAWLQEKIKER